MADLSNLSNEQLDALIKQKEDTIKSKATVKTDISQLSDEQLDALIKSKENIKKALPQQSLEPSGIVESIAVPLGASAVSTVHNAKQLYLDMFGSDEDAKKERSSYESERAQYEKSPIGSSVSGKVIETAGDVGQFLYGGGALLKGVGALTKGLKSSSVISNVATDLALGAFVDPGEDGSRLGNAITSAGIGGATRGVLNAVGTGIARGTSGAQDAIERGARTAGQALDSKKVQSLEGLLARVPFVGTKKALQSQIDETKAAVELFSKEASALTPESLGSDIATSMARRNKTVSDISDQMYAKILPTIDGTKAGHNIDLSDVKELGATTLIKLTNNMDDVSKRAASDIKTLLNSEPKLFSEVVGLKKLAQSYYSSLRVADKSIAAEFKPLVDALDKKVQTIASNAGMGKEFLQANKYYKDVVLPFRQVKFLREGVKRGADNLSDDLANNAIDPSDMVKKLMDVENAKTLVSSLDKEGKNALKNAVIKNIYEKSLVKSGENVDNIDLIKFNKELKKTMTGFGLLDDAVTKQAASGLLKATEAIKKNPLVFQGDNTWQQAAVLYGITGGGLATIGAAPVAALGLGVKGLSSLLTSKAGVKTLQKLGKYSNSDPKLPIVVRDVLTRFFQLQLQNNGSTPTDGGQQ